MSRTITTLVATAALTIAAAGCGSDEVATAPSAVPDTTTAPASTQAVTTTSPTSTTTDPAPDPEMAVDEYAERGPFPVGVTTLQLTKGPLVEVWYPAPLGTTGTVSYDVRDFTPEVIRTLLTGDAPATFTIDGARDVAVFPNPNGQFPVVLFSHGYTGMRVQSSFLTAHLASWGFVVAAPDHPSRDLTNVLGGTASGDRADSVDDLLATLDLLTEANADPTSSFHQLLNLDLVAAVGHSAGGGTVLGAASDARIDGYVSLASGAFDTSLPDKPSMFMAGALDAVVTVAERTRPAHEAAPAPSLLWVIDGAGHNAFDDFCTFGNGTGIIGIAEASGLGPLLDAQPQLRTLGEDGCVPPAVPVATTFPLIQHGVTAWLRHLFGLDPAPVGLGSAVSGAYGVAVEVLGTP
jgi:dienelactone hydrolase